MNATREKELFERMVDRVLAYRPKKAKRKKKAAEKTVVWQCLRCFCLNAMDAERCEMCLTERPHKPREIRHEAGELTELTEAMRQEKKTLVQNARTLDELREVGRQLGYRPGWAWHRYQIINQRGYRKS